MRRRALIGEVLLRIEDIDPIRCRPEYSRRRCLRICAGWDLTWEEPVRRQSEHMDDYAAALAKLRSDGFAVPLLLHAPRDRERGAGCRRGASSRLLKARTGRSIPGTCRAPDPDERAQRLRRNDAASWRLDVAKALWEMTGPLYSTDRAAGRVKADRWISAMWCWPARMWRRAIISASPWTITSNTLRLLRAAKIFSAPRIYTGSYKRFWVTKRPAITTTSC